MASTWRSRARRDAASRHCCRSWGSSTLRPRGCIFLNGESVEKLKARQRARIRNRQIGFIFQAFNLIGDLTVHENVELPLTYRGMPASERKRRVEEALESESGWRTG